MADQNHLDPFRNTDDSTSAEGQRNAGLYEKQQGYQPSPQQSWESHEAYMGRINAQ